MTAARDTARELELVVTELGEARDVQPAKALGKLVVRQLDDGDVTGAVKSIDNLIQNYGAPLSPGVRSEIGALRERLVPRPRRSEPSRDATALVPSPRPRGSHQVSPGLDRARGNRRGARVEPEADRAPGPYAQHHPPPLQSYVAPPSPPALPALVRPPGPTLEPRSQTKDLVLLGLFVSLGLGLARWSDTKGSKKRPASGR